MKTYTLETPSFEEGLQQISDNFNKNLSSVNELLEFDQTILQFCISHLEDLEEGLKKGGIENPFFSVQRVIKALKNIKLHGSTKIKYQIITNQSLVLTVSHFASAIHDLFKCCINHAFKNNLSDHLNKEELKFNVKELANIGSNLEDQIGEIITQKNSISFQDMKSIQRSFKNYFKYQIKKSDHVNNIIYGQACRHAIVHNGAKVDSSLLNQIKAANPNNLNKDLKDKEEIHFSNDELKIVMDSMKTYLDDLMNGMVKHWAK